MLKRRMLHVTCCMLVVLVVGCQPAAPEVVETETAVPTEVAEVEVVETETAVPTATSEPTETAVPTETPSPTEMPAPTETPEPSLALDYIVYYGGRPAGMWDERNFEAFLAQHPEIAGKRTGFNLYSNPVPQSIHGRVPHEEPADVISSYVVGNLRPYVEQGYIADISDLWAEQGWYDKFPQSVIDAVTIDGKQYFVPQAMQWNPIFYRTDIFEEVGLVPPQTWEELIAACEVLNEAGYVPMAVSSSSWTPPLARWFSYINLRLNGSEFYEQLLHGEVPYNGPEVRTVFEHWGEMITAGCFAEQRTTYGQAATQILEGEAAMYNLGEWLSESYPEGLPETFGAFSFPMMNPDVGRGEVVHLYGAFLLSGAENPETGREFLRYLGSVESQASNVAEIGRLASHLEVDQSGLLPVYGEMMTAVSEADHLTQLWEFNAHPDIAERGLRVFVNFFQFPDNVDVAVESLEEERVRVYEVDDE